MHSFYSRLANVETSKDGSASVVPSTDWCLPFFITCTRFNISTPIRVFHPNLSWKFQDLTALTLKVGCLKYQIFQYHETPEEQRIAIASFKWTAWFLVPIDAK